jgi:hypothetical protein
MDTLESVIPLLLAISLASERLVTIIKTMIPWLAKETKTQAMEENLEGDRARRLIVQAIAIGTSWLTVGLSFSHWKPWDTVSVGGSSYAVIALALLGSGGSALWNNLLGYTKAVKDVRTVEKASLSLDYHTQATQKGVVATDSGVALRDPMKSETSGNVDSALARLRAKQPEL